MNQLTSEPALQAPYAGSRRGLYLYFALALSALVLGVVLVLWSQFEGRLGDFWAWTAKLLTRPDAAVAMAALASNRELEILHEDTTAGVVKFRSKISGEIRQLSYSEVLAEKQVEQTRTTPERSTSSPKSVVREVKLPSWLPMHSSMTLMQGGLRANARNAPGGTAMATSSESLQTLQQYYLTKLREAGFSVSTKGEGAPADMPRLISGKRSANGAEFSVTLMLTPGSAPQHSTTLMIQFNQSAEDKK